MDHDIRAIETAVQSYLDGLYEGDADKLAGVFHPTSSLTYEERQSGKARGPLDTITFCRSTWRHRRRPSSNSSARCRRCSSPTTSRS